MALSAPVRGPARHRPSPQTGAGAEVASLHLHAHALTRSLGQPPVSGNRIQALADGMPAQAALRQAIEQARCGIDVELADPEAGTDEAVDVLLRALLERRAGGLALRLIGRAAGHPDAFDALRRAGALLCEPPRAWPRAPLQGLLVADGSLACVAAGPGLLLRLEGPVVAQMRRLFEQRWQRAGGAAPARPGGGAPLHAVGSLRVAPVLPAARDPARFYRALLAAIEQAQHRVLIATDGFVPAPRLLAALARAAARGVDVRLLLPAPRGLLHPLRAGPLCWRWLLAAGVQLSRRDPLGGPTNAAVIDGVWCAVGTVGLDWRSFVGGAALELIVLDAKFAAAVERRLRDELAQCAELLPEHLPLRPPAVGHAERWLAQRLPGRH